MIIVPNLKIINLISFKKFNHGKSRQTQTVNKERQFFEFRYLIHLYLNLSVANPTNAKMIAIIQKRITIVDSAQPFFSK